MEGNGYLFRGGGDKPSSSRGQTVSNVEVIGHLYGRECRVNYIMEGKGHCQRGGEGHLQGIKERVTCNVERNGSLETIGKDRSIVSTAT